MSLTNIFKLSQNKTTVYKEIYAGLITFFSMVYIIFVNPLILKDAGINPNEVFIATCLISGLACILMGFFNNLPIALAPGMGLNALFVYEIALNPKLGVSSAFLAVFISGAITFLFFLFVPAKSILKALPKNLNNGITAGVGIFIFLIGAHNSNVIVSNPFTLITIGKIYSTSFIFTMISFLLLIIAYEKKQYYVTIVIFVASILLNIMNTKVNLSFSFNYLNDFGVSLPKFGLFQTALLSSILVLFLSANFDSVGTFISLSKNLKQDNLGKKLKISLLIRGFSSILASIFGTSTITLFIESNTGVKSGGRTGLTAITIGVLFLLAIFLKPVLALIPAWASSPILMYIGTLMIMHIKDIDFDDFSEFIPALIATLFIPFTYSISHGIGMGFISYLILKIVFGKFKDLNIFIVILALLFAVLFMFN